MDSRGTFRVVALALLVFLAGCSQAPVGLTPSIDDVRALDGSNYEVTVSIENDADSTFHDVQVVGYTARGDRACTSDAGTVSTGSESVTVTCAGFPSVLVPTAAEPCDRTPDESSDLVEHRVTAFKGVQNGTYRTERIARKTCDEPYGRDEVGQDLPPRDDHFRYVRCRQWADDANVSIVDDSSWMDRDRLDPNVTTSYSVRVVDNDSTTVDYVHRSKDPVPEESVGGPVNRFLTENLSGPPVDGATEREVSRAQWIELYDSLDRRSIDSMADVPEASGAFRSLDGPHSEGSISDYRGVDCWKSPEYVGSLSHSIAYAIEYDGREWFVQLNYDRGWSGPAWASESEQ